MSSFVSAALAEIREQIQPTDVDLRVARDRRDAVLDAVSDFDGVLRVSSSGSLAHGTILKPANDADCGVVLDRRVYPDLGPEGEGVGSSDIVEKIRTHLRDQLREAFPDATYRVTKRAVYVDFGDDGPTADLVVALNRRSDPGLWIPHTHDDDWNASHPEKHTDLIRTANAAITASTFVRTIRVLKAWNNQHDVRLCSFNMEALALDSIQGFTNLEDAVLAWFEYAEADLADRLTPDPAGVSDPIKLPAGWTREQASERMRVNLNRLKAARDAKNDDDAAEELAKAFPDYAEDIDKVRLDRQLTASGTFTPGRAAGGIIIPVTAAKATRSWSDIAGSLR